MKIIKKKLYPVLAFIICLTGLIYIGIYASGWLRNSFGDILVIVAIYYFVRIFTDKFRRMLPLMLFAFACFVEFLQSIDLCGILGIPKDSLLAIIIGTTGLWSDILCYAAGTIAVYTIINVESIIKGGHKHE